jgi:Mg2+/Co2+ transporter CorC
VPAPGDSIDVDGLRLTVETTDGRRVGKVLVTRRDKSQPEDNVTPGEAAPTQRPRERRGASKR